MAVNSPAQDDWLCADTAAAWLLQAGVPCEGCGGSCAGYDGQDGHQAGVWAGMTVTVTVC